MIKVIIFGTGNLSKILEKSLNENVEIVSYLDNNKDKWEEIYNGKKVINPMKLKKYDFDYILIGSQFNQEIYEQLLSLGIDKKVIFQFSKYIDYTNDYVYEGIERALKNQDIETIVTGISYSKWGFNESTYNKKSINIAYGGQDLYYDYNLVKYLIHKGDFKYLKEVIIGLCYYSFQYDMSLSSMKSKVALYYKNIKLLHHVKSSDLLLEGIPITLDISKSIFDYKKDSKSIVDWDYMDYSKNYEIGKKQAEIDSKKNYPETVKENIQILEEYLELLINNNIKPIIVVFPASKYYTKFFSERIESEFHNIINNLAEQYNFRYIDYFKSDLFEENDFRDVSHLTKKGAEKFTEILNELI